MSQLKNNTVLVRYESNGKTQSVIGNLTDVEKNWIYVKETCLVHKISADGAERGKSVHGDREEVRIAIPFYRVISIEQTGEPIDSELKRIERKVSE